MMFSLTCECPQASIRLITGLHCNLSAQQNRVGIISLKRLDHAAHLFFVGRESSTRSHDVLDQLLSELVVRDKADSALQDTLGTLASG